MVAGKLYTPGPPVDRVGRCNAASSTTGPAAAWPAAAAGQHHATSVAAGQKGSADVDREQTEAEKSGQEPD